MSIKLNISDARMLQAIDSILESGRERFKAHICENIDVIPQNLRNIALGKQHFTAENIRLLCQEYNIDPNYILGFSDAVFSKKKGVNKNVNSRDVKRLKLA